jgi:hypothetical protein
MPADFPERAGESLEALACIYGISKSTAREWRRRLGIRVPRGAPKGNRNALPRKKGADDPVDIRTCLSCTAPRCRGKCAKVH